MRDWCSECQFVNYGGSQEPCYNCITAYNKKPSEFTPATDGVRGVGTWLRKEKVRHNLDGDGDYRYECSACGHSDEHNENVHVPFCWYCGAKMEVSDDA